MDYQEKFCEQEFVSFAWSSYRLPIVAATLLPTEVPTHIGVESLMNLKYA